MKNQFIQLLVGKRYNRSGTKGAFSFDLIKDIEGGDTFWWTVTPAGLVRNKGLDRVELVDLHSDVPQTARLKQHNGRLHLKIGGKEYCLSEEAKEKAPKATSETTAFTRTVFDFVQGTNERRYSWEPVTIPEQSRRLTFQIRTANGLQRSDVIAQGRFIWDQLISAAHDYRKDCYWTIGPGYLSTNRYHIVDRRPALSPTGFFFEESNIEGYHIRDVEYAKDSLYVLHVPDHQNSPDQDVNQFGKVRRRFTSIREETIPELIHKRVNLKWQNAGNGDYPFWKPMVEFRPGR